MHQFRITKYNPLFRNELGHYKNDDWTSFSDIGRTFSSVVLTLEEYEKIENVYIDAAIKLMCFAGIGSLKIVSLENNLGNSKQFNEGQYLSLKELPFKEVLRENFWCRFENLEHSAFVHFGYDYYMYVGVPVFNSQTIEDIESSGLFVEKFASPYTDTQ